MKFNKIHNNRKKILKKCKQFLKSLIAIKTRRNILPYLLNTRETNRKMRDTKRVAELTVMLRLEHWFLLSEQAHMA